MTKTLVGGYRVWYMVWLIDAPYSDPRYIFAGSEEKAKAFANRLYKQKKFNYPPRVRRILN